MEAILMDLLVDADAQIKRISYVLYRRVDMLKYARDNNRLLVW